jgi:putative glycosyltransferase (TIGR04372 family)
MTLPNGFLLDCWRPYVEVIESINSERPGPWDAQTKALLQDEFWSVRLATGESRMFSHAGALVQAEWDRLARTALLQLGSEVEAEGKDKLEQLGVPKDAWFVCLHVREAGFHHAWHQLHPGTRNADVYSYMEAISTIIERGGYVVRMGDATMKKIPAMNGLIDYAHCAFKSEKIDVFLCAKARFFIGTNSGLGLVPPIFGVPCALTNWSPIALPQWYGKDRFIPKMIYSKSRRRLLTFEEMFSSPAGWQQFIRYFEREQLDVVDNSPEEICELVIEMLDETDGDEVLSPDDRRLIDDYNALALRHGSYVGARIGRDFLRKHASQPKKQALPSKLGAASASSAMREVL